MKNVLKYLVAVVATYNLAFGSIGDLVDKQKQLEEKVDSIEAKQGIEWGGNFRSEYLKSDISGYINDGKRTSEYVTYTQVDFSIIGRPNSYTSAKAIFRMHADWPNFWGSPQNPIAVRWLSMDGRSKSKYVYYHVGDFKVKWTPLTLWTPSVGFLNEPYIFSELRHQQMGEFFLDDYNYRVLQGVNLKYAAKVGALSYIGAEMLGSILRPSFIDNNMVATNFESDNMTKVLWGARGYFSILGFLDINPSYLNIRDLIGTYNPTIPGSALPQNTKNISLELNFNIDSLVKVDGLELKVGAEFATSNDQRYVYPIQTGNIVVDTTNVTLNDGSFAEYLGYVNTIDGKEYSMLDTTDVKDNALLVNLKTSYTRSNNSFNVCLNLNYLSIGKDFRADAAQTPIFLPRRILNIDNDNNNTLLNHYTIFDAMYYGVYKSLTQNYVVTDSGDIYVSYLPYPTAKFSYLNMVLEEREYRSAKLDNTIQLILPFGLATPNTKGITLDGKIGLLDNAIELPWRVSSLSDIDPDTIQLNKNEIVALTPSTYTSFGGGLTLNIHKFLGWKRAVRILGSFEQNSKKDGQYTLFSKSELSIYDSAVINEYEYNVWDIDTAGVIDIENTVINAGLYLGLVSRLAVLGGLQKIDGTWKDYMWGYRNFTSLNLLGGVEYKLDKNAYLLIEGGKIGYKNNDNSSYDFDQTIMNVKINVNF